MRSTKATPETSSPLSRLSEALAVAPDLATALDQHQKALDRYKLIKSKLNDHSVEATARKREADTRHKVVRAQALKEIGDLSANDVETARQEHESARAELERVSGRDQILAAELRKAQEELRTAHDALSAGLEPWQATVMDAARDLASEGLRLLQAAGAAMQATVQGSPFPRQHSDIGSWLYRYGVNMPNTESGAPAIAEAASAARAQLRESAYSKDEEIVIPRRATLNESEAPVVDQSNRVEPEYNAFGRPLLENLSDEEQERFHNQTDYVPPGKSSFQAPGIPASLTHSPLGQPLPEAKALLERPKLQRRPAPYDDPRTDAEEVSR